MARQATTDRRAGLSLRSPNPRPDPYKVPPGIRITPERVGGISGEWVESSKPSAGTLLYLHGGGYFGCSAESHRPITVGFALQGFRVFAPEYRLAPENPF